MKRWAVRISLLLLFLGVGAIVNFAVAWAFLLHLIRYPNAHVDQEMRDWFDGILVRHDLRLTRSWSSWGGSNSVGAKFIWISGELQDENANATTLNAFRAGWPATSVSAEYWESASFADGSLTESWDGGIVFLGLRQNQLPIMVPYSPSWPGFAINTVFYAGVLWMLFAAPFALRRRSRRRRGLCVKCGYDLRGVVRPQGGACPECGNADVRVV